MKIYVVCENYGYEGLAEPEAAFKTLEEAEAYIDRDYLSHVITELELTE